MATLTEVRLRIQGVKNTQKITKAMKIVAATKLRKCERAQKAVKPFAHEIESLLHEIAVFDRPDTHPLLTPRTRVQRVGFVVVSSDRGLCGAFNANLFRKTHQAIEEERAKGREVVLYLLGLKGVRFFTRHPYPVSFQKVRFDKEDKKVLVAECASKVREDFLAGVIDECSLVFNEFRSAGSFGYALKQYLPVRLEGSRKEDVDFIYEESYGAVINAAVPLYMENLLLSAILQSMTSEEASRMLAMDYATENAKTLIGDLTLFYNRTRQAAITKEISEIVGGAEALRSA